MWRGDGAYERKVGINKTAIRNMENRNERKIRVALVEDELPAARLLKSMIQKLRPDWETVHIGGSNEEAVAWFKQNPVQPDILFLDIELSDGVSFEFLQEVNPQSMVVFTTAYDEYAVRAFSVNSIDYLLKPIETERLRQAIEKFEKLSGTFFKQFNEKNDWKEIAGKVADPVRVYRNRFLMQRGNQMEVLLVEDVAYFFSENKITYAQTFKHGSMVVDYSLDRLGEELDPTIFFRATRQILLCSRAVSKIENYFQGKISVTLTPPYKEQVLVSKEKAEGFKQWLDY